MFERIFGFVFIAAIGLYALREAHLDRRRGVGRFSYGPPIRRDQDPGEFKLRVRIKMICGIACLIAAIAWAIAPWGGTP